MEIALLSIPLRIAAGKIADVIGEQIGLFADATKDLEEIRDKFQSIEAVLADAERKQITDESVRVWLSKLKGIALDIEDVVDGWKISSPGSDSDDESKVRSTCLPLTRAHFKPSALFLRRKIAVQVKEIRNRLDAIHGDRLMSSFSSSSVAGETETMRVNSDWRQTSSFVEESEIIGRDEDKKTVIRWLVSDAKDGQQQEEGVHVTAIVGIGGLGKTTFAQQIFNDPEVKDHFNQALYWVCVSDVFDVIKLTKDILEAVNGGEGAASSSTQLNVLQNKLLDSLRGKRYLLILDDIWNEDDEKWKILRLSLKSGGRGSRILVTTRSKKVAEIMNASSRIYELKCLPDDLSWELFCSRAFPGKKKEEFSEFESIGREIVNRCKGVPLSIKVMGSTMNTKTTTTDWKNISDSEMWSLPEVKGGILPVLQISYYNLPPYLKQCFAYCSIYDKDAIMFKHKLVNLWVAQGFIRPAGNREMEDIGEEYFNSLVSRSMFQEVQKNGGKTRCKMHDLLHDLATAITQDEKYIITRCKNSNPQCPSVGGVRHASLFLNKNIFCPAKKLRTLFLEGSCENGVVLEKLFCQARYLRAFVWGHCWQVKLHLKAIGKLNLLRYLDLSYSFINKLPDAFRKMKHLRYLDLSGTNIDEWPDAFKKMKHLRYLDLSSTKIEKLPESMSHLVNLHTLILDQCSHLKSIHGGICKLVGLRHLCIDYTYELDFLPEGIGKLASLQSLSKFIVGRGKGECGLDELQELNSLQECVKIEGLDRVSKAEQAMRAQLCNKQCIRKLVLDISSRERDVEDDKEEERIKVLECLRPHPNLQDLSLDARSISKLTLPSWIEDPSFSNLSRLSIDGFQNQWGPNSTMPGLGKLPSLRHLKILGVGIRKLGDEFYYGIEIIGTSNDGVGKRREVAFPKLESLILKDMGELEEWELTGEADACKVMPSLSELRVDNCPKLQLLPSHLAIAPPSSSASSSEVLEGSKNYCDELMPLPPSPDHGLMPLECLIISSCRELQSLPHSLGQLKKLKSLEVSGAIELTCLPDSLEQLESLEKLKIEDCSELESLPHSLGQLKKLKSLEIYGAIELTCLPDSLEQLESLEKLTIEDCSQLESLPHSLGGLKKLKSVWIKSLKKPESLPDWLGLLESLEELAFDDCYELESLPHSLGTLKKLKSLTIKRGKKLESLPDLLRQMESLEQLEIDDCCELESLLGYLGGLKKLTIGDAEKLESLPDSLGQLASLESLEIRSCNKLKSLPHSLGRLQKLKILRIGSCEELEWLPKSLQGHGLVLGISDCPRLLAKRPADIFKVSHIKKGRHSW